MSRITHKTLYEDPRVRVAKITIPQGKRLEKERHTHSTQITRLLRGEGIAIVGNQAYNLSKMETGLVIPAGVWHEIINVGKGMLVVVNDYSPPE